MKPSRRANNRSSPGQSLVEFALTLPLLILILIGTLDLGRMLIAYVTIQNAAREGARYGVENPNDTAGIMQHAEAESANSGITITDSMIPTPIIQNDGTYRDPPDNTQPNQSITVQVNYPFTLITTYLFAGQQNIQLNVSATMQIK